MQNEKNGMQVEGDVTPDSEDRLEDFFARHGGPGSLPRREEHIPGGDAGWYEVYAADGYCLRCDWSRIGGLEELRFSELAPHAHAGRRH